MILTEAPAAPPYSAEFELTWWLTESLEFSGWYAYTDAEFSEFTAPDGRDLSIYPFARAPKNVASAALDYTLPLDPSTGYLSVGASYWYTDEYSSNDDFHSSAMVDSYSLVNLRADWKGVFGSQGDIGAYVRNATDEEYTLEVLNLYTALGFDGRTIGEPRNYGIRVTYNFGDR